MEQLSIYHELGFSVDPVYEKLARVTENNSVLINGYEVCKNFKGLYEIASNDIHDCASSLRQCYVKLSMYFEQDDKQDAMNVANVL